MAIIHRTTMAPTKLELLTSWLPGRPWYAGGAALPRLTKAGGFRLDDPDGEVGLEFMAGHRRYRGCTARRLQTPPRLQQRQHDRGDGPGGPPQLR